MVLNSTSDLRSSKLVTFAALRVSGLHVVPWYVMVCRTKREVCLLVHIRVHIHPTVGYGSYGDSEYI